MGIGAGTVAGNILYVPAKVVYGILGGITGGASYLVTGGNTQTANTIWRSSLGGDYVLTPGYGSRTKADSFQRADHDDARTVCADGVSGAVCDELDADANRAVNPDGVGRRRWFGEQRAYRGQPDDGLHDGSTGGPWNGAGRQPEQVSLRLLGRPRHERWRRRTAAAEYQYRVEQLLGFEAPPNFGRIPALSHRGEGRRNSRSRIRL